MGNEYLPMLEFDPLTLTLDHVLWIKCIHNKKGSSHHFSVTKKYQYFSIRVSNYRPRHSHLITEHYDWTNILTANGQRIFANVRVWSINLDTWPCSLNEVCSVQERFLTWQNFSVTKNISTFQSGSGFNFQHGYFPFKLKIHVQIIYCTDPCNCHLKKLNQMTKPHGQS